MGRVNADYNEKQGISNIFTLTNVVTDESVELITSDSEGNFSYSGIVKAPLTRNAMQTTQSSGEWSDLEYPCYPAGRLGRRQRQSPFLV